MGGADSKVRDLKVAELIERGFAALPPPTNISTVKAAAAIPPPATPASQDSIPTVKVNRAPDSPAPAKPSTDLSLSFQVTPTK